MWLSIYRTICQYTQQENLLQIICMPQIELQIKIHRDIWSANKENTR